MSCTTITGLNLDKASQSALDRIKEKKNIGNLLAATVTTGVFNSIFTKNKPPVAALNISQTDWELYSKAMASLPAIQKRAIQKEIDLMIIHYQMGKYDHNHIQFWKGMKHACK
ncbi:hypothetical protein ACJJIF_09940 [Microbulbifer sp. SSSA002]|uniref:hypothetical protein n=1 Tax=Microbulbifer sp. SSSA002 TaxID=3243376 RepID=UPI004039176A